jgi:large subunit ribosomal protein L3
MTKETAKETAAETQDNSADKSNTISLPAFFGIKAGMTRIFDKDGNHIPVTVIKLIPNYIAQVKTMDKDGYEAYQVAYNEKKAKLVNKPSVGHLKKNKIEKTLSKITELRAESVDASATGKEVSLEMFAPSTAIDVTGTSKGKGFQGVIKRFNFSGGPGAHGSKFHRGPGSIGNRATPGKVWKNKKMPGHMGSERKTVQNLSVVEVNQDKGYMLVRGSVPGSKNSFVRIAKSVKK